MKINNINELEKFAYKLKENLKPSDVVNLIGDLGAGKTTLVQKIGKYMNVESDIVSPTFALVNIYDGDIRIYHLDLYRLEDEDQILDIDFETYLYPQGEITFIEWSNKAESYMPDDMINIEIKKLSEKQKKKKKKTNPKAIHVKLSNLKPRSI